MKSRHKKKHKYKVPYPTIGEIIADRNYDYVSYRQRFDKKKYKKRLPSYYFKEGMFAGAFEVENGKIKPLDGDTYSLKEEVIESEEWVGMTDEGKPITGLTIITKGELYDDDYPCFRVIDFSKGGCEQSDEN